MCTTHFQKQLVALTSQLREAMTKFSEILEKEELLLKKLLEEDCF